MSSWRDEYLQALQDRDEREQASYQKVDADLIEAFTHLLDRTAALEAEKAARIPATTTDLKGKSTQPSADASEVERRLRSELAEALRSNGQLQSRVKAAEAEVAKLRAKTKADTKTVEDLSREKLVLTRKFKDRDDEMRGKSKLLDDVHDEVISLNLQLNMSEQTVAKLKNENKELIDRWMDSKRKEAEEMNETLQHRSKER